ncbi:polysaccharide biosynthesis/export family protein [Segetibacter aerophilus]|uniref:polysaccharide biosynthesis/export family protein n=1 Tax=Segetibacter aerophilus TaxID=670293 RepID=UPI001FE2A298|nr:polysaccharide biosynthesis/export family protein [Segetibacter aerophilus]
MLSILIFNLSCIDIKKAVYFNDTYRAEIAAPPVDLEPVIQKSDLLSISVMSLLPAATEIFNIPNENKITSSTSTGTNSNAAGYLVDKDGYIFFPILGNIKAAGLTKKELRENIVKSLVDKKLLLEPNITIRYLNFKVTVLGEVGHPTVVNVQNEKITLLEALGLAGDVTISGRRDNVRVIRDEGVKKIVTSLNLNSSELFTSPYYYLKSNDIVYVEPNRSKVASTSRTTLLLPVIFSALSVVIISVDRLLR